MLINHFSRGYKKKNDSQRVFLADFESKILYIMQF